MEPLRKGRLVARLAEGRDDMGRVMALRAACFPRRSGVEEDAQDTLSAHVMVEGPEGLLAYFRVMLFGWGAGLERWVARSLGASWWSVAKCEGGKCRAARLSRWTFHSRRGNARAGSFCSVMTGWLQGSDAAWYATRCAT